LPNTQDYVSIYPVIETASETAGSYVITVTGVGFNDRHFEVSPVTAKLLKKQDTLITSDVST